MHSMSSSRFVVVVLACGLVSLAAERADACSCAGPGLLTSVPRIGATDVVRDARIFLTANDEVDVARTVLVDDADNEVPITVARLEFLQHALTIVTPSAALAANTHYTLRFREGADFEFTHFTTGDALDDGVPAKPNVELERTWSNEHLQRNCAYLEHGAGFAVDSPDEAPVVLASRDGPPEAFDAATLTGRVATVMDREGPFSIGSGTCVDGWPDAEGGASATFVFALVDRAGNVSEWSDPVDVTLPPTTPTCSHVDVTRAAPSRALLALCAALVLGLRRRRTRTHREVRVAS